MKHEWKYTVRAELAQERLKQLRKVRRKLKRRK